VTTPAKPPRPAYVWVLVGCAVAVALLATVVVMVSVMTGDSPAAQETTAAAPQQPDATDESPLETEATTEPTPSPTPSATPSTAPPTKAPTPAGTKRTTAPTATSVDSSVYDCPDGRNNGVEADKFVPCINGALRLELSSGTGTVTLYSSTTQTASVELKVSPKAAAPKPDVTRVDWVLRQSTYATDNKGEFYRLRFFGNSRLEYFGVYYRLGPTDGWKLLESPASKKFSTDTYYQVIVFWNDPEKPAHDAPLPPGFAWSSVQKPASS